MPPPAHPATMPRTRLLPLLALLLSGCGGPATLRPPLTGPAAASQWEFDGNGQWAVEPGVLVLQRAGVPGGALRRPAALAVYRSEPMGSLELTAQVRADAPADRRGRDVLLVFGYQSPTRFYYAHLSNETTAPHNGIYLVDDADRLRLNTTVNREPMTDQAWHRVRLVRDAESGRIEVYMDDMSTPVLSATDTTLRVGRIGFGSFDDPAAFRDIEVHPKK